MMAEDFVVYGTNLFDVPSKQDAKSSLCVVMCRGIARTFLSSARQVLSRHVLQDGRPER